MKRDTICIGDVKLPLNDFVVSRNAILGITKSGKTYTAKGIAEQLIDADIPIVVFDAIGVWRYLKIPGPGGRGFPVVVAGGLHPDLPLNTRSAPEIVRAAIQQNISLVIDLYDAKLSKADWRRIVQDCFRVLLYENKGLRHIFLEEAAEYAPQKVMDGQTYAEVEKLARMGGNASLGITFINQRAQELNKAVLELCDNIVLLRQRGTHAIDSLERQMEKLSPDLSKKIASSMPSMTQGHCWVFTEKDEVPFETRSNKLLSYHPDRRNPDENKIAKAAVNTDVFVSALRQSLEALVEQAKENDPAELKKQIAQLKKELASKPIQEKEVSVLLDDDRKLLQRVLDGGCDRVIESFEKLHAKTAESIADMKRFFEPIRDKISAQPQRAQPKPVMREASAAIIRRPALDNSNGTLGRCERSILTALAQYPQGRTTSQIAILTGYSANSGGFNNSLSRLRSLEYITRGNPVLATQSGIDVLGEFDPLPVGQELLNHWMSRLGKCEREILGVLAGVYPGRASADEVAASAGYSAKSGGFNNALSKLRTLELITRGQPMQLSKDLFE